MLGDLAPSEVLPKALRDQRRRPLVRELPVEPPALARDGGCRDGEFADTCPSSLSLGCARCRENHCCLLGGQLGRHSHLTLCLLTLPAPGRLLQIKRQPLTPCPVSSLWLGHVLRLSLCPVARLNRRRGGDRETAMLVRRCSAQETFQAERQTEWPHCAPTLMAAFERLS